MRCLTLARALRERGANCHFVCRNHPGNLAELIRSQGFSVDLLPRSDASNRTLLSSDDCGNYSEWLGAPWEKDAEQTANITGVTPIDWIIVDHYGIDQKWEKQVRPFCKQIMVIDDLANRNHDCDLLLDQNLIQDYENRYSKLVPERCACLLGPNYSLLQSDYTNAHRRTPPRLGPIARILVYFGGADLKNLTGMVLAAFQAVERPSFALDVVVNAQSPFYSSIREMAGSTKNVVLHDNLPSLCELMIQADIAIGASGATNWERCCMGLPSYVVTIAENQEPIAKELNRKGFVKWLGSQSELSVQSFEKVMSEMLCVGKYLEIWSSRCRDLVDGHGTERVTDIMLLGRHTPLRVRQAELSDEEILLNWANDSLVRKNSFSPDPIGPSTHRKWFYDRLRNQHNCKIYIIETVKGLRVGQVRFELSNEVWAIDYSIGREFRGKGLAEKAMHLALNQLRVDRPNSRLVGEVKSSNPASKRVFEKLGFKTLLTSDCVLTFTYFLN